MALELAPPSAHGPGHLPSGPRGGTASARRNARAARDRLLAACGEEDLVAYYDDRQRSGRGPWTYAVLHPGRTALAVVAVLRLPRLLADLREVGGEAAAVRGTLLARSFGVAMARTGVAVLDVPERPAAFSEGRHQQTLRRKVRAAQRSGTTTHLVTDDAEKTQLLRLAHHSELTHRDATYRTTSPDVGDLPGYALWMVAASAQGAPLLLAITPVAGRWATLRYFRTLGAGPEHSDSRYLATQALVEELSLRGVRHLADTSHPAALTPGLRHFQRMLGFRLRRVDVA